MLRVVIIAALTVCTQIAQAQQRETERKTLDTVKSLTAKVEALTTRDTKEMREIANKAVADAIAKNPQILQLASLAAIDASKQQRPDQQEYYRDTLAKAICLLLADCSLKTELNDLRNHVRDLEQRGSTLPDGNSQKPAAPFYTGHLDYVLLSAKGLCARAERISPCVNVEYDEGSVVHGDVWRDCSGKIVLVLHTNTNFAEPAPTASIPKTRTVLKPVQP